MIAGYGDWPLTADYPQIWVLAFAACIWVIGRILPSMGAEVLVALGWITVLAALLLMLWATVVMRRAGATVNPHAKPTGLVTSGPFRFSRNPIYLGDALLLAGLCLAWRALPALLLIPLFIRVINRRFIGPEEARLRAAFPRDYPAWASHTRSWL